MNFPGEEQCHLGDVPLHFSTTRLTADGSRVRPLLAHETWLSHAEPLRRAVWRRDWNTCRACGFRSWKYQDALCLGRNARDLNDLVTLCTFCAQCFRLDLVPRMESGRLICLPETSQVALHHLVRDAFVQRLRKGQSAARSDALLAQLNSFTGAAEARIGTSDPGELALLLERAQHCGDLPRLERELDGIRLLPANRRIVREGDLEYNQMPQILAYWRSTSGPFATNKGDIRARYSPLKERLDQRAKQAERELKAQGEMNSGIFILSNGTPCIVYDGEIPHVHQVEFHEDGRQLALIWRNPATGGDERLKLAHPVSDAISQTLHRENIVAVARIVVPAKVEGLHVVPIVFVDA